MGVSIGVDLLGYNVLEYLALVETTEQVFKVIVPMRIPTSRISEFLVPYILNTRCYFPSFILATLMAGSKEKF